MATCPICHRELKTVTPSDPALSEELRQALPFCSQRCKLVDLGSWVTEGYRVPGERAVDVALGADEEDEE